MDDIDTTTATTDSAASAVPDPAPARHSAVDQAKDAAKRILATITGRSRS